MNQTITATALSTAVAISSIAGQGTLVPGIGADVNFSGSTMPTAVSTESIENTRSSSRICPMMLATLTCFGGAGRFVIVQLAFEAVVDFPSRFCQ